MGKPRILLHIGTEKTATTSLQRFFAINRALLIEQSVLYPTAPGFENHVQLAQWATSLEGTEDVHSAQPLSPELLASLPERLRAEIDGSRCDTVILSNEHCHSRVSSPEHIAKLVAMLRGLASSLEVIVYFRRQDELEVSRYSTELRSGDIPSPCFGSIGKQYYYDYQEIFSRWACACDRENVIARIFDPERMTGRSILRDVVNACGLRWDLRFVLPSRLNEAIDARVAQVLVALQPEATNGSIAAVWKKRVRTFLASPFGFTDYEHIRSLFTVEQARVFVDQFSASNAGLAAMLGVHRPATLFSQDYSMYPREPKAIGLEPSVVRHFLNVVLDERVDTNDAAYELARLMQSTANLRAALVALGEGPGAVDYSAIDVYDVVAKSGFLDDEYYLRHNPDVRAEGMAPLIHFVLHGAEEGRDPGPAFDVNWYTSLVPDLRERGINPVAHYVLEGLESGLSPRRPDREASSVELVRSMVILSQRLLAAVRASYGRQRASALHDAHEVSSARGPDTGADPPR